MFWYIRLFFLTLSELFFIASISVGAYRYFVDQDLQAVIKEADAAGGGAQQPIAEELTEDTISTPLAHHDNTEGLFGEGAPVSPVDGE